MSHTLSTPNTSPTPSEPGRWIITKFGPPSVLKWETWDPLAELSSDKVLVRILVAGIAGVDNIQRAGGYPDILSSKPGFTPGYDLVGEVVSLGSLVPKESRLAVGDRVAALCRFGGYATHIVLPYEVLMRLEPTDDLLKITALPLNYMTSWGLLKHSGVHLTPGSTILIGSASGGLGTAMAQIITAFDMGIRMIGTSSLSKFDYLRSLGMEPIDRNAPDLVEQVRQLTNGEGVDVAYDGVGSKESLQKSLATTKKDVGKVVVFGVMGDIAPDGSGMQRSEADRLEDRLQPPLITFYTLDTDFPRKAEVAEFYGLVERVRSGKLDPVVAKLLRLSEALKANELLIEGSSIRGKMLFVVDADLAAQHGI